MFEGGSSESSVLHCVTMFDWYTWFIGTTAIGSLVITFVITFAIANNFVVQFYQ